MEFFFYLYFILPRNVFNYFYNMVFSSGINLKKFKGVDLSYIDLSYNYFLCGADLEDANLTGSNLNGVDFRYANLKNAKL